MNRFLILLLIPALAATALSATESPTMQVRKMVESVVAILERSDLGYPEKRSGISRLIQQHIDIEAIAKRTLGTHWRKATPRQRERFSALFIKVLEATYLHRIREYSGGQVDFLKERIREVKAIVDARFVTDRVQVPVRYKLLLIGGNWQIYDVEIENVSLVRNYRSSYGEIINREGFDGLFARLEKKISEADAATAGP